tara:strand:+ start:290 stop:1075 length:786 start_codon:yes stop_codon:yes gene_type:complete
MDKTDKQADKRDICILIPSRFGKAIPLEKHPEMIRTQNNSIIAKEIARKLSVEKNIINLYIVWNNQVIESYKIRNMIEGMTNTLLNEDIIAIRETKKRNDNTSRKEQKLNEIIDTIKQAQDQIDSLDNQTKSHLNSLIKRRQIDSNVFEEIISNCKLINHFNNSQTCRYYIPIFQALLTFNNHIFYIEDPKKLQFPSSSFRYTSKQDWELFKQLTSQICFNIFSTLINSPDSLNDTRKGLVATFNKIKEVEANYFSPDFRA